MKSYIMGEPVRISAVVTDLLSGALADPAAITVTVIDPTGARSSPPAVHDGLGNYHADIAIPAAATSAGVWQYRFETSQPNSAGQGKFRVPASLFYP